MKLCSVYRQEATTCNTKWRIKIKRRRNKCVQPYAYTINHAYRQMYTCSSMHNTQSSLWLSVSVSLSCPLLFLPFYYSIYTHLKYDRCMFLHVYIRMHIRPENWIFRCMHIVRRSHSANIKLISHIHMWIRTDHGQSMVWNKSSDSSLKQAKIRTKPNPWSSKWMQQNLNSIKLLDDPDKLFYTHTHAQYYMFTHWTNTFMQFPTNFSTILYNDWIFVHNQTFWIYLELLRLGYLYYNLAVYTMHILNMSIHIF